MLVTQSCPTLYDPMDCNPPGSSVHRGLQARILEWVAFPFSRGSSNPGIEPGPPALQVDYLPAEPPGKPKNTGVGSLSLLQQIFPTQELSQDSLHCRRILYQLSYERLEGSPLLWASSKKQNDSFEQVLLPVRPTEKSTWWKISRITQQKMYNLPSG